MLNKNWRDTMLKQLEHELKTDKAVEALLAFGSFVDGAVDVWSDLDIIVVVAGAQLPAPFSSPTWLDSLGTVFACEHYQEEDRATARVCFTDGRRLDAVILSEARFLKDPDMPPARAKVCFASTAVLERLAVKGSLAAFQPASSEDTSQLVNSFWFKTVVAVHKVARNDLLIAYHLCL